MERLRLGVEVLIRAEAELRSLMQQSLAAKQYREVGQLAPLADSVSELVARTQLIETARPVAPANDVVPEPRVDEVASPMRQPKRSQRDDYPLFKRDGEKLVKIGWSKKDRREYEHRAPQRAVFAVASEILSTCRPGSIFSMDTLLPFHDESGGEIPSYQAYLALAWLRDIGAVQQQGKDGYVYVANRLASGSLETAWDALTAIK